MSDLICYSPEQIPDIWSEVRPHIKRALDRGSNYTLNDVYYGLVMAEMQLWTSHSGSIEAALVTTIQNNEDSRWCLLLAAGGTNLDEWVQWLPIVEKWAAEHGCQSMEIYGRIGWSRKIGYAVDYTKMSKQL